MGEDGKEGQDTVRYAVKILGDSSSCRELLVPNARRFVSIIPKHIATFDEEYALRCLELIRSCALRAAAWKFVARVDALPDDLSHLPRFDVPGSYDVVRTNGEVMTNSAGDWIAGTVTYSPSMINILKSPLLRSFGSIDYDVNYGQTSLLEVDDSPKESIEVLSHSPIKEITILDSASGANSSCSGGSPSSATVSSLQGMLRITWKNGLPHLMFTVDGNKEIILAVLSKTEASDGEGADYAYTFHSRRKGKKGLEFNELDFEAVGKMDMSSSVTSGCNNTETVETRFVLSVPGNNDPSHELQISNQNPRKHSVLTRKVANAFKSRHSFKQQRRTSSKFEGPNAIFEDGSWEPSDEVKLETPNLELAAIIVKEVFENPKKEADCGGWGLKFLKKLGHDGSPKTILDRSDRCTSSLNVLIPAGVHGGPRTRAGGPTSLIERWTSGGKCDCGGWDMGCPLTILDSRPSCIGSISGGDSSSGECKSVNLFTAGSKQDHPVMNMANIHEEETLYYIHFQPTLSFLQSFAIAASILHCRSPILRSKLYGK